MVVKSLYEALFDKKIMDYSKPTDGNKDSLTLKVLSEGTPTMTTLGIFAFFFSLIGDEWSKYHY